MPNAWLNHVRQVRKNNRNMSYKQLLSHAKNSYSGGADGDGKPVSNSMNAVMNTLRSVTGSQTQRQGGGVTGFESRSSLTRSASTLGGRRSRRKTRRRRR
jgi:hypothetical protein